MLETEVSQMYFFITDLRVEVISFGDSNQQSIAVRSAPGIYY